MVPWKMNGWVRALVPLLAVATLFMGAYSPQMATADDGLNYDLLGRSAYLPEPAAVAPEYNLLAAITPLAMSDAQLQPATQGRFVFTEPRSAAPKPKQTGPTTGPATGDVGIWFPGKRLFRGARRALFRGGC